MRTIIRLLLSVIAVLAAAWLGLRWYAEAQMQAGMTEWVNQMNADGDVKVSYDGSARDSAPLAASFRLTNLRILLQPDETETPVAITLPSFALRINAVDPWVLHFDWPNQIGISTSRGDGAITFGSVSQAQTLDPRAWLAGESYPFSTTDTAASDINILASGGSLLVLHIDAATAHGVFNRAAGAGQMAFQGTETLDGIALSPLLTRLASIPFDGKITHLGLNLNLSGPAPAGWAGLLAQFNAIPGSDGAARGRIVLQAVQGWAAAGGGGDLGVGLVVGPSALQAKLHVKFDANAQPSGTADLTVDHLDAFSAAVVNAYPQTQNSVNRFEARFSPYFSSSSDGGQTLGLHVTYGPGVATINGQPATPLPPINWAALENPAPPAPGDGSGAAAP